MEGEFRRRAGPQPSMPVMFDGMALPPFPPLIKDAKKRFEDIKSLDCRQDDVLLVAYPKSGDYYVPSYIQS